MDRPSVAYIVMLAATLTLMTSHSSAYAEQAADPFERIEKSEDVAWLERIAGSLDAAANLKPSGRLFRHAQDLRTAAYARLGALGTKHSLAAVKRVEEKAKTRSAMPNVVSLGTSSHPCSHFAPMHLRPMTQAKTDDGITYAIVQSTLLGGEDLFLTTSKTPERQTDWSRPRLIPDISSQNIHKPLLSAKGKGMLVLSYVKEEPQRPGSFSKQELEIALDDVFRDTDEDGWTDFEELRLGLDPKAVDTDQDGLSDGEDTCPNYAPPADQETDRETLILQKAMLAAFGMSDSRHLIVVPAGSRKLQLWGYSGPVIYLEHSRRWWQKKHSHGAVFVSWSVTCKGDEATVKINDYEGPEGAAEQHLVLQRINGTWAVVRRQLWRVS